MNNSKIILMVCLLISVNAVLAMDQENTKKKKKKSLVFSMIASAHLKMTSMDNLDAKIGLVAHCCCCVPITTCYTKLKACIVPYFAPKTVRKGL